MIGHMKAGDHTEGVDMTIEDMAVGQVVQICIHREEVDMEDSGRIITMEGTHHMVEDVKI
jgi:hypothetical protein